LPDTSLAEKASVEQAISQCSGQARDRIPASGGLLGFQANLGYYSKYEEVKQKSHTEKAWSAGDGQ